jgi:hypothetical protein
MYDLLRKYLDIGAWNELFIDEREAGPTVVFRANPFLAVDGKTKIQADAPDPVVVDLPAADVSAMNVERSDSDVPNYYWVEASAFFLVGQNFTHMLWGIDGANSAINLTNYQNSDSKLYGERLMKVATVMGQDGLTTLRSGQDAAFTKARDLSMIDWITSRRNILAESNKDNVLLERGMMRVRGRPDIRPGMYVKLQRGGMEALYYVIALQHSFQALESFTTTLIVERGLGFVERAQRGGGADSPYLSELKGIK